MRTIKLALLLSALSFLQVNAEGNTGENEVVSGHKKLLMNSFFAGLSGGALYGGILYALNALIKGSFYKSALGITTTALSALMIHEFTDELAYDLNGLEWNKNCSEHSPFKRLLRYLPLVVGGGLGATLGLFGTGGPNSFHELADYQATLINKTRF